MFLESDIVFFSSQKNACIEGNKDISYRLDV